MRKLLVFILLLNINRANSQNLVPNPSFEDTLSCPNGLNSVSTLLNWFSARPSPDYFNFCSVNGDSDVPLNYWGYQFPASGNGYIGLTTYYGGFNTREFVGVHLISPLNPDSIYYISLKAVLGLENSVVKCASNNLGLYFSNTFYDGINDTLPVNNQANLFSPQIITDTLDWIKLSFSFQPDSNYNYLYIGNFFDDIQTDIIQYGPSCAAYYYLDDICVSTDSNDCPDSVLNFQDVDYFEDIVKIFPNPFKNNFAINFKSKNQPRNTLIYVYNLDSKLIYSSDNFSKRNNGINCEDWPTGIYIIKIFYDQYCYTKLIIKI